jgi:urease accessory protein
VVSAQLFDPGPELAGFTDEPKQLPSGAFGKDGHLKLGFAPRDGRTLLTMLDRRAPLLAQQALYWDEGMPGMACVYIICNSGGILQGDRYAIEIELAAGAEAHVTTQAATKIHEMDANHAVQSQTIVLDQDSYLEYVPQATIPFRHSRFLARTSIVIAESATLLLAEMLMPGRKYYG